MKEIERVFREYSSYSTSEEYDYLLSLLEEDYGKKVNTKEENGYIDIYYNNRMGEYKAKLLIDYLEQNKGFYQYFLKKCSKVIIGKLGSDQMNRDGEIFIDNYPREFDTYLILEQMLKGYKNGKSYAMFFKKKIEQKQMLLSKEKRLDFVGRLLLNGILEGRNIDFYTYLDLIEGSFINIENYYQMAMVDIAFEHGYYGWLDAYMRGNADDVQEIKKYIFQILYREHSLDLCNKLLGKQFELLDDGSRKLESDFIKSNLFSLTTLFENELPKIFNKYKKEPQKGEKVIISKKEIINLVIDFLKEVDSTNKLAQEFVDNLDNGNILLWDKNNGEERKRIMDKYSNMFGDDIEEPICLTTYNENEQINKIMVNVPLSNELEDAVSIVHEFFHLHSGLSSMKKRKNGLLTEFPSIYFEELFKKFMIKKGYNSSDFDANFRIMDALFNFSLVLPVLNYLKMYLDNGNINLEKLNEKVNEVRECIIKEGMEQNLTEEEIQRRLTADGLLKNDDEIIREIVLNVNMILLRYKRSIFLNTPYLLGAIFANSAMENNCGVDEIINISDKLNDTEDLVSVMQVVGIDVNGYGFRVSGKNIS